MQEKDGYIYILINPMMGEIVKIGKTSRDPVNRVKELSSATGVPTPFILVYKEEFDDCSQAEQLIHNYLEENGYRLSANREFFNIPVYEAIKIVQKVKESYDNIYSQVSVNNISEKTFMEDRSLTNPFVEELLEKADDYYYGNNELQDYDEALKYFEKAAKLGSAKANRRIGKMYYFGESVNESNSKAIEYLKKSARQGDTTSYGELARIYSTPGPNFHGENKLKCWDLFFNGIRKRGLNDTIPDYFLMSDYLYERFSLGLEVENIDVLTIYKNPLMRTISQFIELYKSKRESSKVQQYEDALVFVEMLEEDND